MVVTYVSDADLVARSRLRDAAAFGSLVERHQRLVFGVALARCGDPALAEDVAQEAFVAAWNDLDRLRDVDRVGSWVAGIARNLAATAARSRARRDADLPEAALPVRTPEDEALSREDRELLQRALADIPVEHREALVLFYLQGHSIAQIAADLGVREDLVKQRLSRGRRGLRESVTARVESALARVRPGPAFGIGVVAAVSALTTREAVARSAARKAFVVMSGTKKLVAAAVVAILVLVGGVWLVVRRAADEPRVDPASGAGSSAVATPSPAVTDAKAQPRVRRMPDPSMRASLLDQIRAAKERRAPAEPGSAGGEVLEVAPRDPDEDKAFIASSMKEVEGFVAECYANGLARNPKLSGTVTANLTIEGEPGVGGVIGDSKIDDASSGLKDPEVLACIQETLYALEIEPPSGGGSIPIRYSFAFSADDGLGTALITGPPK
jgi:RNA polymerase sigma factor (sigma-70 family)